MSKVGIFREPEHGYSMEPVHGQYLSLYNRPHFTDDEYIYCDLPDCYSLYEESFHILYVGPEMTIADQMIKLLLTDEDIDQLVFRSFDSAVCVQHDVDYKYKVYSRPIDGDQQFLQISLLDGISELVAFLAGLYKAGALMPLDTKMHFAKYDDRFCQFVSGCKKY